jgi:signal transduction histidine kinase
VRFHNHVTLLGWSLPATFLILVNIALWKLWKAYKKASGQHRTQLKYLFWGSAVGYLGGSPDWFFVFGFHIPYLSPFGIYCVPLYSIAMAYAVLHHKLFEVNLIIRKSLVYSILVTLLTAGYFGLVYSIERFFQLTFGYQSWRLSLTAFALMALLFQPLKIWIQRLMDWLIFRTPQHELVRRLERLEQEARKTEKLKAVTTLAAGLCHELRNPLQTIRTHAEFLPERYNDPEFRKRGTEVMRTEIDRDPSPLLNHLQRESRVVLV